MNRLPRALVLGALGVAAALAAGAVRGETLHRERSLYRNIVVSQVDDRRCMQFEGRRGTSNQSCILMGDRYRLVLEYNRLMFAGFLVNPAPRRLLIVGLGGGAIHGVLRQGWPKVQLDTAELDPAVLTLAKGYFDFQEGDGNRVQVSDARVFVRRAALRGDHYDYIMLDAFSEEYVPEHLMTREFLEEVRGLLSDDGVVVANTFAVSDLYDSESVTYEAAFGRIVELPGRLSGNRIILAARNPNRLTLASMQTNLARLPADHKKYGVNYGALLASIRWQRRWREDARILTDQYSPANILQRRPR